MQISLVSEIGDDCSRYAGFLIRDLLFVRLQQHSRILVARARILFETVEARWVGTSQSRKDGRSRT
jgi:hypothetical protein